MDGDDLERRITRRDFALRLAAGVAVLPATLRRAVASDARTCVVYPRQTEGPFYVGADLVRRDVTDGKPGVPLRLLLDVVAAGSCAAIEGAAVDVWHCDATGLYSGYPGQLGEVDTRGERFLRGSQITDRAGRVRFDTIFPGWYPGRTTHVHFKVRLGSGREATSQVYFPEEEVAAVYRLAPYAARGQKDTTNAADGVVRFEGLPPLAALTRDAATRIATLTIAVGSAPA